MVLVERTKLRVSKNFSQGDIFLYLLNIFATAVPKLKQKNIKNYSSILAIVNHWNWLDDSPPLKTSVRNATSPMLQNKKLKRKATSAIAKVAEVALCASICALPTSE